MGHLKHCKYEGTGVKRTAELCEKCDVIDCMVMIIEREDIPLGWGGDFEDDTSGEWMDGSTELDLNALNELKRDNDKEDAK